ncbi:MAG: galactokinase [Janthinobacterium lividum]
MPHPDKTFAAPGRVNLIGEHTDYTGGLVLPMALPFVTSAELLASDAGYRFTSASFPEVRESDPGDRSNASGSWSDYPVGVLREILALGIAVPPFALHLTSDVPLSAGLSSSAAIEVATAVALLQHANATLNEKEVALLCQRAENHYVGAPSGIMDQFVVTAATEGHALLLNTRDLHYDLLPMNTGGLAACSVVIANSMVKHSVATGDYRVRRRELEEGQSAIRARFPEAQDLGASTMEQLEAVRGSISNDVYLRCKHVITENARVREAGAAMRAGDARRLGEAMVGSHISQRDDFQDSVAEIDFLVDTALSLEGCHGARLTGGGFGGCTVNLVETAQAEAFSQRIAAAYRKRYNIDPEVYTCKASDGALARLKKEQAGQ